MSIQSPYTILLRDTLVGRLVRSLTQSKVLPYPDEISTDGYTFSSAKRINEKPSSSSDMAGTGLASSTNSRDDRRTLVDDTPPNKGPKKLADVTPGNDPGVEERTIQNNSPPMRPIRSITSRSSGHQPHLERTATVGVDLGRGDQTGIGHELEPHHEGLIENNDPDLVTWYGPDDPENP